MKLGIILGTNNAEATWNAFRLGNTALKAGNGVSVFLMNSGVEVMGMEGKGFDIRGQRDAFVSGGGNLIACGTCMISRDMNGSRVCPASNMVELLKLIEESDKVVSFG
jgi:sulfur relay (sulfurtransferase) complex TusBCD TusD component (DsrE family)